MRDKTILGILWTTIGQFGSQAIRYLVLLVLAWLLSPTDFGLLGVAMIFVLFSQAIGELGLAAALIQRIDVDERDLSTAFWANLLVNIILATATYISAEPITTFLGDSQAAPLLRALSVVFPIMALAVVPRALLQRDLQFRQLTYREFSGEIAYGLVGLLLAWQHAGPWSLVGAVIAQRLFWTVTLWLAVPWRPKAQFDMQALRSLLRFGLPTMFAALLNRGLVNVDYFVIGRWFGAEALGYYTLAYQLAVVPHQRLVDILRRVAFPAFSQIQTDLDRLQKGFMEAIRFLFALSAPLSVLVMLLAPWFIQALYGNKWEPAIRPIQFLAVAGLFYGFDVAASIYFAMGRPQIRIWILGLRLSLFAVFAASFGVDWGIGGVAISISMSVAISALLSIVAVSRLVSVQLRKLVMPLILPVAASGLASLPIIVFNATVKSEMAPIWSLIISAAIVMPFYMLFLNLIAPNIPRSLRRIVQSLLSR